MHSAPASSATIRCASCGEREHAIEVARCRADAVKYGRAYACLAPICRRCREASDYGYCAEHEAEARAISDAEGD